MSEKRHCQLANVSRCSVLVENQVKNVATSNMGSKSAEMDKDSRTGATGILEGISQNSKAIELQCARGKVAILVGGAGQGLHG